MKTTLLRAALIAVAFAGLAGCATVKAADAGAYKVGDGYSVTLGRQWSDISGIMVGRPSNVRLLSLDGPLLNRLYLTDGIAPDGFLVKPTAKETPTPTYRTGLSQTELVEFVVDSIGALDFERPESANLRPAKFGAVDGLRFDVTATTKQGLNVSGTSLVAERGGKLHVILYLAPSEHYYQATLPEVENVMATATLR